MKNICIVVVLIATTFSQKSFAQDSSKQDQLPQLLNSYYNIKNALVSDNPSNAALAATSFVKSANSIDYKGVSKTKVNFLVKDADKISKSKDINKQREYFSTFSTNMAALAKEAKLTDQPIYYEYCPMKKAYWLSSEKEIKNPYYGSNMLTCGKVSETIQ